MSRKLYAAFFTGVEGTATGIFFMGDGIICGADNGGLKYDGTINELPNGTIVGTIKFKVPALTPLITGLYSSKDQIIPIDIKLLPGFDDGRTVTRIETPTGPINAIFEFLRELPNG